MSSPAPDLNNVAATTATATTRKSSTLKAVTGFGRLDSNVLSNTAHIVAKGIGGYPQYFEQPPVSPAALDASATTLAGLILSAMEGGKSAKAALDKRRKLVIQDLNLLAVYVQNVS